MWSEPTGQVGEWMPAEQRPLAEVKASIGAFLQASSVIERGADPWASARQRLRADPHALVELEQLLNG